jgi:cyclomaltodextrinase / maltogenic alpha-amylase / neopullulanase
MNSGKVNRKEFLRLLLLAVAGASAVACEPVSPTLTAVPEPSSTPTLAPGSRIKLNGDGDAWTWNKVVYGHLDNTANCKSLLVSANGIDVKAAVSKDSDSTDNSTFSATIPLVEGDNRVIAVCQLNSGQEEKSDMNHFQERLRRTPAARINITVEEGQIILDGSQSQMAGEDGPVLIDYVWSARPGNPAPLTVHGIGRMDDRELSGEVSGQTISLNAPIIDGEYYVELKVKDEAGREDTSINYFVVENAQARVPDYDRENSAWVESAVVYGVIPLKFGHPAFEAITNRLDYLVDLGVNALWLAPVNVSPPDDYGYAVMDYFDLNHAYGTKVDFHRMVQEAHARGIRVLMDFVPNHSSDQHPYFVDTKQKGRDSNYWDFYARDESGNYTHYFNWTNLPNLNYDNPEVQRMMTEAFSYWVREFDVDGFRVDAAWGVKERRPDFWPEWRRALKRIKPDLLLLAEASARDPYYFDQGFDAAYDWTSGLGQWAWKTVWDTYKNRQLAYNLEQALTNRPDGYHPDALIFRFLNNNDTGDRFITKHGPAMTMVSTAMLLTLPGIPCIYTGDEVGAEFSPYESLGPIGWNEQVTGLRDYHKKLIALHKEIPSLHSRLWLPLEFKPIPQEVYGYIRYTRDYEQPVIVLLNFFEEPAEMEFDLPEAFSGKIKAGSLTDLITGETVSVGAGNTKRVTVPGLTARVLALKS